MYYISYTADMNDWDAWEVGEDVDWNKLDHAPFETEEDALAYIQELKRLDRINKVKYRYVVNKDK